MLQLLMLVKASLLLLAMSLWCFDLMKESYQTCVHGRIKPITVEVLHRFTSESRNGARIIRISAAISV